MPETQTTTAAKKSGRRKTLIGQVVSNKMNKTIVVQTTHTRAHSFYRRVVSKNKKFYAHDEQNTARVGDFVRLEETRPLSKLKRWRLKDIISRAAIVPEDLKASAETKAS
jgi:small subunit ribosomal protein S17